MTRLRIGLSMLYCLGETFDKMIEHLQKLQTKYIELVDDGLHTLNRQRVDMLRNIGESYGLKYSVHSPFADINIASPSQPILKATLKRLRESIAYANALDAYVWVFHPGLKTGVSMFYPGMDWRQNLKTVRLLLRIADDYGVKIAIENVPEPFPFLMKSVEDFMRFYAEVDEDVGMVFDVGHANLNEQMERFLTVFADRVMHVHAHDNDGKGDLHLGIGEGTVNWESFGRLLRKISYDKVVVIESVENIERCFQKLDELFVI